MTTQLRVPTDFDVTTAMGVTRIAIPFPVLRYLLPADGEVESITFKQNVWPKNAKDGPFFRDEALEIAFGQILRARKGDRKHEHPWPPGFLDKGSFIAIQGGWRLHRKTPKIPDFFDGTFAGKLQLLMAGQRITARLYDSKLDWNGGILEKIVEAFKGDIEAKIADAVQNRLNELLSGKFRIGLDNLIKQNVGLQRLKQHTNLSVDGTSFVFDVAAS